MKTAGCCELRSTEPSGTQRAIRVANWLVPSIVLAALPKCPVCVAAYVTLFTGCGISLATAGLARWLTLTGCIAFLTYLSVRTLRDLALQFLSRGALRGVNEPISCVSIERALVVGSPVLAADEQGTRCDSGTAPPL